MSNSATRGPGGASKSGAGGGAAAGEWVVFSFLRGADAYPGSGTVPHGSGGDYGATGSKVDEGKQERQQQKQQDVNQNSASSNRGLGGGRTKQ